MHYQVGVMAAGSKLDGILCYGAESAEMARAAKEHGMKLVVHATDKDAISNWLKNHLHKGDCVIFKASRGMKLEEIIQTAFVEAGGLSK